MEQLLQLSKQWTSKQWPWNFSLERCPISLTCSTCFAKTKTHTNKETQTSNFRQSMAHAWNTLIPFAFCINLKERSDRFESACQTFHDYGLCQLVTFVRVEKPDDSYCVNSQITSRGRYGCWQSHSLCAMLSQLVSLLESTKTMQEISMLSSWNDVLTFVLKTFKQHNDNSPFKPWMVLEDDVMFMRGINAKRLHRLQHDMVHALPAEWELLKLGQMTLSGQWLPHCSHLIEGESIQTHCMIWSPQGTQRLLTHDSFLQVKERTGQEWDIDEWLRHKRNYQTFCVYPQMVAQTDSPTSNVANGESWFKQQGRQGCLFYQRNFSWLGDLWILMIWPILLRVLIGLVMVSTVMIGVGILWTLFQVSSLSIPIDQQVSTYQQPSQTSADQGI